MHNVVSLRWLLVPAFVSLAVGTVACGSEGPSDVSDQSSESAIASDGYCDGLRLKGSACSQIPTDSCIHAEGCVLVSQGPNKPVICTGTVASNCTAYTTESACTYQYLCSWKTRGGGTSGGGNGNPSSVSVVDQYINARLVVNLTAGPSGLPFYAVRHRNFQLELWEIPKSQVSPQDGEDVRWNMRPALAPLTDAHRARGCFSLEAHAAPGFYVRHRNFGVALERSDGTAQFNQDATFCALRADAIRPTWQTTIRMGTWYLNQNWALRHQNFGLKIDNYGPGVDKPSDFDFDMSSAGNY